MGRGRGPGGGGRGERSRRVNVKQGGTRSRVRNADLKIYITDNMGLKSATRVVCSGTIDTRERERQRKTERVRQTDREIQRETETKRETGREREKENIRIHRH